MSIYDCDDAKRSQHGDRIRNNVAELCLPTNEKLRNFGDDDNTGEYHGGGKVVARITLPLQAKEDENCQGCKTRSMQRMQYLQA